MKTFTAITTPIGEGGIGVVQVSGPDALEIVNRIFNCKKINNLNKAQSNTLFYGTIHDNNTPIDEAIVNVYNSLDGHLPEHLVEINCHGGIFIVNKVLDLAVNLGAIRTTWNKSVKRFDCNYHDNSHHIDLIQEEALSKIPATNTKLSAKVILDQYRGALSSSLSHIISIIDDIVKSKQTPDCKDEFEAQHSLICSKLNELICSSKFGLAITTPEKIAVIGRPNTGKSTLINALLGKDRVVVHNEPGTTRDPVSELISIKGIPFELIDTAGLRKTEHKIEMMGIELTNDLIQKADKLIVLFDSSKPLETDDIELLNNINSLLPDNHKALNTTDTNRQHTPQMIMVLSKTDLPVVTDINKLEGLIENSISGKTTITKISSPSGKGLDDLENRIASEFMEYLDYKPGQPFIFTLRQLNLIQKAYDNIKRINPSLKNNEIESGSYINILTETKQGLQNCSGAA